MATDTERLQFIYDRLVHHHYESPNFDYMHALKEVQERVEKAERIGLYPWGPSPTPPRWERPEPTHFTEIEGGIWHDWTDTTVRLFTRQHDKGIRLHAIKFSDGSIFDMFNGWRSESPAKPFYTQSYPYEDPSCSPPLPGPTETSAPPSESATTTDSSTSLLLEAILSELRTISTRLAKLSATRPSGATEVSSSNSKADTTPAPTAEPTVIVDTLGLKWAFHSLRKGAIPELFRWLD